MILLASFAFFAGIVTILSPCILPILPIVLSSTVGVQDSGKSRPFGVVVGFIASFTFFTLFLSSIVRLSGIPSDSLRLFSVIVIFAFGASLLIPQFQVLLERLFSRLASFMPQGNTHSGFGGGIIIGLSLGLLWTPCVGPILASVISLAVTGAVTIDAFLITFAYSLGTAIPMLLVMLGGQSALRHFPWLLRNTAKIQKIFGIVMILTAMAIFFNFDRKFQTFVLNAFPQYGVGLTKFEDISLIQDQLKKIGGNQDKKDMGKPMYDLNSPKGPMAPELIPGGQWFNSKPLTLKDLRGKVVIVDFWTYSCINCQRTFPYLKDWWAKYHDKGLVIIGVHSPEFEFEKDAGNVKKALNDFGITYPVVQDNNFSTWQAYDNHYWPAKYFIDKDGYIRYTHFGEGAYDESEKIIQELLLETGAKDVSNPIHNPQYQVYSGTPETYLGYGRLERFSSNEEITPDKIANYTSPNDPGENNISYIGNWEVMSEYANPQKGASMLFNFQAKEVYLVMRPKNGVGKVKVYVDGKAQYSGVDVKDGVVTIDSDRLYKLVNLPTPGRHILRLEFQDSNVELFAFTFG